MLEGYQPKQTPDGRFDYQLVSVHVPRMGRYISGGVAEKFARFVRSMGEETQASFAHSPLDLRQGFDDREEPLFSDIGVVQRSSNGQILDRTALTSANIVLVGRHVGRCHLDAYRDFVLHGAREIHIPLNGVASVGGREVEQVTFDQFGLDKVRTILRNYYINCVEGRPGIHLYRENGIVETLGTPHPDLLAVVYWTWDQLKATLGIGSHASE